MDGRVLERRLRRSTRAEVYKSGGEGISMLLNSTGCPRMKRFWWSTNDQNYICVDPDDTLRMSEPL